MAREQGVDPSELRIEEEIGGFEKEVYWVKHAGEHNLDVPMFLRPTSETPMYTMFSLWIRSHADLPLKTFQIVNTFRYETKQTRSFIRVREIHFFEAHTAHADQSGADAQIDEDSDIVRRLLHDLCLPAIISKRPVWDTFPGAWYTNAVDAIMPNGRTLQIASYHHYRDQWARAFDITYEGADGSQNNCHQTTFGMSERLLGAVVGVHGDDAGLIMPPSIAPIQVVVMPVAAHLDEAVEPQASKIVERLKKSGIRARLDSRDMRPGAKHYDWEIKGVPLRLEIGPRDLSSGSFVMSLRTGTKASHPLNLLEEIVLQSLEDVSTELRVRSSNLMESKMSVLQSLPLKPSDLDQGTVYEVAFDGNDADAEKLEKSTNLTLLGDSFEPYESPRICIITGKETVRKQHLAKMY
ncbi:MAG: proline--tRNA ligase [Euryarchaeota archaeon]|nr:proline--tRNA ligase [Euryarchaeota archaeon]